MTGDGDRSYVLQVYRRIFTQFSHLYSPHTSSACLLLFKVAKPEPETRVQERPNPKHRFGNSRPGLDLEGLVCTEVGIKTVSRRGRPNCHASASWTSDKFSLTGTLDTDTRPNCYYLIKYDLT